PGGHWRRKNTGNCMAVASSADLNQYWLEMAQKAHCSMDALAKATGGQKEQWLRRGAALLREKCDAILAANEKDLQAAPGYGLTSAQVDRLRLSPERVDAIARGLEEVAALPEPIGEVIESSIRPNGLQILKVRV